MKNLFKKVFVIVLASLVLVACANNDKKVADLSDDIYDFTISIEGDVFKLPMTIADLETAGWKTSDRLTEKIAPNEYSSSIAFRKDGKKEIRVGIDNLSQNTIEAKDGFVTRVYIDLESYKNNLAPDIMLSKGITGKSTQEAVIEAFGEPSYIYESDTAISLDYDMSDYSGGYEFWFSNYDKKGFVLTEISIYTRTLDEDQKGTLNNEVSKETPQIVKDYKKPTALGEDFREWRIKYGDNVYQLPTPVSTMIADGWILVSENDPVAAKDSKWGVKLRNGNQSISVNVTNYDENAQLVENTFVTEFEFDDYSSKIPFELAKGITPNSTVADVETAFGKGDFDDSDKSWVTLSYGDYGSSLRFIFDETGKMISMTLDYSPEFAN
ncbi:hypothetical protein G7062_09845 [Erysipelothrix sp. HDW6C]|uniref:hypothetical protein n=1 Tax=Erysipelothrix sp. HDW6C TaxID=2714930 RepID=UPI001407E009|nr:hypothetical protein [Erysipelothrix sp. HDW6C]QIK70585.1 hypothetical protein G7062_09845 [Erysipelothrix sp. HDW6C]